MSDKGGLQDPRKDANSERWDIRYAILVQQTFPVSTFYVVSYRNFNY